MVKMVPTLQDARLCAASPCSLAHGRDARAAPRVTWRGRPMVCMGVSSKPSVANQRLRRPPTVLQSLVSHVFEPGQPGRDSGPRGQAEKGHAGDLGYVPAPHPTALMPSRGPEVQATGVRTHREECTICPNRSSVLEIASEYTSLLCWYMVEVPSIS